MLKPIDPKSEQGKVAFRRLLLCKQLFQHGKEHSSKPGALNKMIAVHNMHNAIEVALRSILLHYEIRSDKEINIGFEAMLDSIDNHEIFKEENKKLPYRPELRNLNQMRNMVQHHAAEPPDSQIDDWKVFTKNFLAKVFGDYFRVDFESVTQTDLIEDERLRRLLELAREKLSESNWDMSLCCSRLAFDCAVSGGIRRFVGEEGFSGSGLYDKGKLFAAILSSGVALHEYKRLLDCAPDLSYQIGIGSSFHMLQKSTEENADWAIDFVERTVIAWQLHGLSPVITGYTAVHADSFISNMSISSSKKTTVETRSRNMPRSGRETKGSRKAIQDFVNDHKDVLNALLQNASDSLAAASSEGIKWLSPLKEEDYLEYRDDFLRPFGLSERENELREHWPPRGPQWDALASMTNKNRERSCLLVEAKSYLEEIIEEEKSRAEDDRLDLIKETMQEAKNFYGVPDDYDWVNRYYQLCNRLAFLYLMNEKLGIPTYLALVCFLNDKTRLGDNRTVPSTENEWREHLASVCEKIGLPDNHPLQENVVFVFPEVLPSRIPSTKD